MNKLTPLLLALASAAALAQGEGAPVTMHFYAVPAGDKSSTGLDLGALRAKLGLRLDSGEWHFDFALPDVQSPAPTPAAGGPRALFQGLGDVSLGVSRSFGAAAKEGSFWDVGNFSLGANAGYSAMNRAVDDGYHNPWSGSVGAAWNFSTSSHIGLNYRIEASPLPEAPALRSLGLSYGYQFTSGLRLNTSLGRGLSDGAPRWGGGLSISFSH